MIVLLVENVTCTQLDNTANITLLFNGIRRTESQSLLSFPSSLLSIAEAKAVPLHATKALGGRGI